MHHSREVRADPGRSRALNILSHTEFAAAVKLVVEIIFLYDLKAALLEAAFSPVLFPPDWREQNRRRFYPQSVRTDRYDLFTGPTARLIYLVQRLPA